MARFARRHGFRWSRGRPGAAPPHWSDLECFRIGVTPRVRNVVEGERHGRAFTLLDYHYDLPGQSGWTLGSSGIGVLLADPFVWYLLPAVDKSRDPVFSAVVVECPLPPGARSASAKKGLAPWRVEFGARASVIRSDDGYRSPSDLLAAVDRLNAALDEVVRAAPAPAA
jgi:hypothetical protein